MPIIDVPTVKTHLGLSGSDKDAQLQVYVDAVIQHIADVTGMAVAGTHTRTFDGVGANSLVLDHTNVTVTSIVQDGITVDPTYYVVDSRAGIIYPGGNYIERGRGWWNWGRQNLVVTYTTADAAASPTVTLAALEGVRLYWELSQQGNRPAWGEADSGEEVQDDGELVFRRVASLLGTMRRRPVVG